MASATSAKWRSSWLDKSRPILRLRSRCSKHPFPAPAAAPAAQGLPCTSLVQFRPRSRRGRVPPAKQLFIQHSARAFRRDRDTIHLCHSPGNIESAYAHTDVSGSHSARPGTTFVNVDGEPIRSQHQFRRDRGAIFPSDRPHQRQIKSSIGICRFEAPESCHRPVLSASDRNRVHPQQPQCDISFDRGIQLRGPPK